MESSNVKPTAIRSSHSDPTLTTTSPSATRKWLILALVSIGTFMTTLDASIVNISMPSIAHSFNVGINGTIEWIIIVYLVVIAASLLTVGRASDMFGRKPLWCIGLGVFTVGSMLCGLAPSLALLIAARALQGLGASMILAPSVALLTDTFPPSQRGQALGLNATFLSLGVCAGPTIGGLINQYLSWRWIFYVNVPLGVICVLLSLIVLTRPTNVSQTRFDFVGMALLAVGLVSLTLGLSFGQEWGWLSISVLGCFVLCLVSLIGLVWVDSRVSSPLIDLKLLSGRIFATSLGSLILNIMAMFAISFLLPFYYEELRGFSSQEAGLLITPYPITIALLSPVFGSLADRIGTRWLAPSGLLVVSFGIFLLAQINSHNSMFDIIWRLIVIGVGFAMFQTPNTRTLMATASAQEQGEASGLLATGRVVGQSLSIAIAGAIFSSTGGADAGQQLAKASSSNSANLVALQQTFVNGLHIAFLCCAGFALVGALLSLVRGKNS